MPYKVRAVANSQVANYSSGGNISITLDRIPGTLTELWLRCRQQLTVSAASGLFDDIWDRWATNLALNFGTTSYFSTLETPLLHHLMRSIGMGMPRISFPSSASSVYYDVMYRIHFGTAPYAVDLATGRLRENPFDLTAGVPPLPAQSLTLAGTWGTNTSLASSGVTINTNTQLQPYFTFIAPAPGESQSDFLPAAYPTWTTEDDSTLVGSATSNFSQNLNLPINDWIQGVLFLTKGGSTVVRSDNVLTDFKMRDNSGQRDIFQFLTISDAAAMTQQSRLGNDNSTVPVDGPTVGTFVFPPQSTYGSTYNSFTTAGVYYFDLRDWISEPDRDFGLNMDPAVNPYSQLSWQWGTNSQTGALIRVLYRKYKKNNDSTFLSYRKKMLGAGLGVSTAPAATTAPAGQSMHPMVQAAMGQGR